MIALWMLYAVAVAAALATAGALLDRTTSATFRQRRWIWVLALGLSAGIPTWTVLTPRLGLVPTGELASRAPRPEARATPAIREKPQSIVAELVARADISSLGRASNVLAVAWLAATIIAVTGYVGATWSLGRRRRSWRATHVDGHAVLLTPATGPAVIGALRPQIVVPEWSLALPADQRDLMLEHERQHVTARDPLLLRVAASIALLMPWNIMAWWLLRRLRLAIELDCDARVLATGRDSRTYGNLLLDVCTRRLRPRVMLSPALFERSSSLTRRILAMNATRPRFAGARAALGVAAAVMIVAFACDMPSPEVVAPDGTNQATKRLYGEQATNTERGQDDRAVVARYFPRSREAKSGRESCSSSNHPPGRLS